MSLNINKLCLEPEEVTTMIYHNKCVDGFTSALCCYLFFKNKNKNIKYIAASFDDDIPNVVNENVLICDFSYKKEVMKKLLSSCKKLVILDHHKSAEEDLAEIPEENKIFDSSYSGAYLAWKYFFREKEVPDLIKYVQDNDLFLNKLYYTKEIISYISSFSFEFSIYEKFIDNVYLKAGIKIGRDKMEETARYIERKISETQMLFLEIGDKYYLVPHVQSYTNKSEFGHKINEKYKNIDFCVIYSYDKEKNKTFFSLRSNNNNMDTTKITTYYQGGGHRNASGFILDNNHNNIPAVVLDKNLYKKLDSIKIKNITINSDVLSAITINYSCHKDKVGKYLLQYRDYNEYIQQGAYICKNNGNIISNNINIALIWHERKDNKTYLITVVCDSSDMFNIIKNYFESLNIICSVRNNVINITIPTNYDLVKNLIS